MLKDFNMAFLFLPSAYLHLLGDRGMCVVFLRVVSPVTLCLAFSWRPRDEGAGAAWLPGILSEAGRGDPAASPCLPSSGGLTQWRTSSTLVTGSRRMLAVALRGMVAVTGSQTERDQVAGRDSERPPESTVGN